MKTITIEVQSYVQGEANKTGVYETHLGEFLFVDAERKINSIFSNSFINRVAARVDASVADASVAATIIEPDAILAEFINNDLLVRILETQPNYDLSNACEELLVKRINAALA